MMAQEKHLNTKFLNLIKKKLCLERINNNNFYEY